MNIHNHVQNTDSVKTVSILTNDNDEISYLTIKKVSDNKVNDAIFIDLYNNDDVC